MSNLKLKDYKQAIAAVITETRKAIEETLELINNHEDSPNTLRDALDEIEQYISNLESEISCMEYSYIDLLAFIGRLNNQRDEAIKQRNILARQLKSEQKKNTDFKFWC